MEKYVTYIKAQIVELTSVHNDLSNIVERDNETIVSGTLAFEASADELETISESFDISLMIPHAFPDMLPKVIETGGRIGHKYTHLNPDGTLCLAIPVEQRRKFLQQPTLLGFVDSLIIPYLYGFSYWGKYGEHPFDEAVHGNEGILRHYISALKLRDEISALATISFLFEHGYRGHHDCPCGSDLKVRTCHGAELFKLFQNHTSQTLQSDFLAIVEVCTQMIQAGKCILPISLKSQVRRLLDKVKKHKGNTIIISS